MKYQPRVNVSLEVWKVDVSASLAIASILCSYLDGTNYSAIVTLQDGISTGLALNSDQTAFIFTTVVNITTATGKTNLPNTTNMDSITDYLIELGLLPSRI